jgi:fructokinase
MNEPPLMVGLGEVLWDHLPSGKVLGGAPANFAYMTRVFGNRGIVASRIGDDEPGRQLCQAMRALGLSTSHLQQDGLRETGSAEVSVDATGLPTFTIKEFVAWDFLQWTPDWEQLSKQADVVCFGSLAQRSRCSADTVDRFLQNTRKDALRIFDVNLRQSFYSADILRSSFRHANIAKLTNQELVHVSSLLGMDRSDEENLAKRLFREFELDLVCVTRGARGSLLISQTEIVEHTGVSATVVDTVGAGDAFAACLAHYLVRGRPLSEINESANRFASWVATQMGATPKIDRAQLRNITAGATISNG